MINLKDYISPPSSTLLPEEHTPWVITGRMSEIVTEKLKALDAEYVVSGNIAIHKTAVVEQHVIMKGPVIISANCFVGAHAYLRGGVFLAGNVSVGPGCEIKSSFILSHSAIAHFNFVGDSIIGSYVNMEAGSIIANHHNDRENKIIHVAISGKKMSTGITKFGALVGDHSKIGANAVLSPGTILLPKSVVKRLELVEQT